MVHSQWGSSGNSSADTVFCRSEETSYSNVNITMKEKNV